MNHIIGKVEFVDGRYVLTEPHRYDAVINKYQGLPRDYVPGDLVIPDVRFDFEDTHEKRYLRKVAAQALSRLFDAAEREGIYLLAISGYRSYIRQQHIFREHVARMGEEEANRVSAKPGESEHQTGLSMDISTASIQHQLLEEFSATEEGKWIEQNAYRFGFIIRYPKGKESITGYVYEPWHLRYVGIKLAESLHKSGLTLEEYLMMHSE